MDMIKIHERRQETKTELLRQLNEHRAELARLHNAGVRKNFPKIELLWDLISQVVTDLEKIEEEEAFASRFTHQASLKTE